jgi:ubiquinone/menaquinone biosynthesis C-methylase UbiE
LSGWRKKKTIANRYDETSAMYDVRYADEQEPKYEAALNELHECRFGKVLDAGCGTGLFFRSISLKSELIVGLDISRKSLLTAKTRASSFCNVDVVCGDADFMPFTGRAFSHAFAFTLVQNMPKPEQTLIELKRAVAVSGKIMITGLKRIYSKKAFLAVLEKGELNVIRLVDADTLNCYVAVCVKTPLK